MLRRTLLGSPVDVVGLRGNRIACQVAGPPNAYPVILTSGIGCGPVFFRDIGPKLARSYRTIFWDFRAHGQSDLAPDGRSYRPQDHAEDLQAVIRTLADRPPVMIGFSMGVQVTMEWIRRFDASGVPAYVFLLGTPFNPLRQSRLWGSERIRKGLDSLLDAGADRVLPRLHVISKALLRSRLSYAVAKRTEWVTSDFSWRDYSEFINYSSGVRPDAYLRTATGLLEHDATEVWQRIDSPIMYVWGGHDRIVPTEECRNAARLLSEAQTSELEGRSHAGSVEAGQELALKVSAFIDQKLEVATTHTARCEEVRTQGP
jgi:pimeloyl-ACP methyl ester carboxylesterase